MKRGLGDIRLVWHVGALVGLALLLILIVQSRPGQMGAPPERIEITAYPPPAATAPAAAVAPGDPYPPPYPTRTPSPPAKVQALLSKRNQLGDVTTVTLARGRIWLIPPEGPPTTVTDYTDVAALYGWNYAGGKLLFGRGVYETRGGLAPATELWVYDLQANKSFRLVDSTQVWSASWSPVDDRVAYCEYGDPPVMFVVDLDGKIQQKRESFYPGFTWSSDGTAIAVENVGAEMMDGETKFSALGVWRLRENELQLVNDATREDHSYFIWTIDGTRIIFHRSFGPGSEPGEDGMYIADLLTGTLTLYPNDPKMAATGLRRSPNSDDFIYSLGPELYLMQYGREPVFIGKGQRAVWHPHGAAIYYYDETGQVQSFSNNVVVENEIVGGDSSAITLHLQPDIYFAEDITR